MLDDSQIRAIRPTQTTQKRAFGKGLYLYVTPNDARSWVFRFARGGSERLVTLGSYPAMSISKALDARDERRAHLDAGRDPAEMHRAAKVERDNSFESVARDWLAVMRAHRPRVWSERHSKQVEASLVKHVFPHIGHRLIGDIDPPTVLGVLLRIDGTDVLRDVLRRVSAVFQHGIFTGKCVHDPAAAVPRKKLPKHRKRHFPALAMSELPVFFARLRAMKAEPVTYFGILIDVLIVLRNGRELRLAEWREIDFEHRLWVVPGERMKGDEEKKGAGDHFIPLGAFTLELLRELRTHTGESRYLFPSPRNSHKPISNNTWGKALRALGYSARGTMHGMRSTFSTAANAHAALNGYGDSWKRAIELQLDHVGGADDAASDDETQRAYDRSEHPELRREIMEWWDATVRKAFNASKRLADDAPIPVHDRAAPFRHTRKRTTNKHEAFAAKGVAKRLRKAA